MHSVYFFVCMIFLFCDVLYFEVLSYFGESTEEYLKKPYFNLCNITVILISV